MAIYPALFGHVELPDVPGTRQDRDGAKLIGIRIVRPADLSVDVAVESVGSLRATTAGGDVSAAEVRR